MRLISEKFEFSRHIYLNIDGLSLRGFTAIVMSEAAIGIIDGSWLLRSNVTIGNDANTSVVNLILFNLQDRENYRVSNLHTA